MADPVTPTTAKTEWTCTEIPVLGTRCTSKQVPVVQPASDSFTTEPKPEAPKPAPQTSGGASKIVAPDVKVTGWHSII